MNFTKLFKVAKKAKRMDIWVERERTSFAVPGALYIFYDMPEISSPEQVFSLWGVGEGDRDGWVINVHDTAPEIGDISHGREVRRIGTVSSAGECVSIFATPENEQRFIGQDPGEDEAVSVPVKSELLAPVDSGIISARYTDCDGVLNALYLFEGSRLSAVIDPIDELEAAECAQRLEVQMKCLRNYIDTVLG